MAEEVKIRITSEDNTKKGIDSAEKNLGGLEKAGDAFAKKFLTGAAFAGAGLALANFGKDAIMAAADFEVVNTQFEVLTGNAEEAGKMLKEITELAGSTPLETKALQENAKQMLSYGIATEDILPNLRMLGDLTGGNAEKMGFMTMAFSQMSAAGKANLVDIKQMINAGFNPLQEIARTTGDTYAQVMEKFEAGEISMEMIRNSMVTATSEGGRFNGMMEKLGETFTGRLAAFGDAVNILMIKIGEMLLPIAGQVLEFFSTVVNGMSEMVTAFSSGEEATSEFAVIWQDTWNKVQEVWTNLVSALWPSVETFINDMSGAFSQLKTWIQEHWFEIQLAIQTAFNAIQLALDIFLAAFQLAWEVSLALIGGIIKTAVSLITGDWQGAWNNIKQTFTTVWDSMKTFVEGVLVAIGDFIYKQLELTFGDIDGLLDTAKATWDGFWGGLLSIVQAIVSTITSVINNILIAIESVISGLKRMITEAGKAAANVGLNMIGMGGVSTGLKLAGAKADGGRVTSGRSYLVGEEGAEIFTPTQTGNIIPNHKIGGSGLTVVNNFNGIISSKEVALQYADQVVRELQLSTAAV